MSNNSYIIRNFKPNDETAVWNIMFNGFDEDEPMLKYLLTNSSKNYEENGHNNEHNNGQLKGNEEETKVDSKSLVAVEDGQIIGVAINELLEEGQQDVMYSDIENYSNREVLNAVIKIHRLLDYVGSECKISSRFPSLGKGILLDKLFVDSCHRGKGIAKKIIEETRNVAKRNGCNYIKVIASSLYTALALERLGFEKIYSINYKDYKVNGEVVFKIEPPHTSLAVYIQQVDDRG